MKLTSITVLALFLANTSAIKLQDDCNGKWCNKGLPYDLDEGTLRKAESDNAEKDMYLKAAKKAHKEAKEELEAAVDKAKATAAADTKAGEAKAKLKSEVAGTTLTSPSFDEAEKAYKESQKTKQATYDASLNAADAQEAAQHIFDRKTRDLAAATAAKKSSDANLAANQARVAHEMDQLHRGENQDRLR